MRPGPFPHAENDLYIGGPDIGQGTKTEPPLVLQEDGYYRGYRPAPDCLNWALNRAALAHRSTARMQVANWQQTTSVAILAGYTLESATHHESATATNINAFLFNIAAGNVVEEVRSLEGLGLGVPASSPVWAAPNAVALIDSDADDIGQRMVAIYGAINDLVRYNNAYGAATWNTAVMGAPALNWQAIGCDRNTAAAANARWLVGDDAGGGNSVLFTSTAGNPPLFGVVATWPVIAEPIRFIGHTCHPVGAMGPDDLGNPSWLIMTTTRCCVSANGLAWSNQAHGLAGAAPEKRTVAYSRSSRRWVAVLDGGSIGDVAWSADNGATWTTIVGALSPAPAGGIGLEIACDGFGTFVITEASGYIWHSVDDGMTWTRAWISGVVAPSVNRNLVEPFYGSATNADDTPAFPQGFTIIDHDGAAPLLMGLRSLVV